MERRYRLREGGWQQSTHSEHVSESKHRMLSQKLGSFTLTSASFQVPDSAQHASGVTELCYDAGKANRAA